MINRLFLRQHKRLILLLLLASDRPLMVCAQSVQKHVGYVPGVSLQLHSNGKYLKRNEVPLGYHKNLPLLHRLFKWGCIPGGCRSGVGICLLKSSGGSVWLLCSKVSLLHRSLAWCVGVMNYASSNTSQLPSLS